MDISRRAALGIAAGVAGTLMASGCAVPMLDDTSDTIDVSAAPGATSGKLQFGSLNFACMLGRGGILKPKHEGDGGTPAGLFPLREVRYRPDRLSQPPKTRLATYPTLPSDGWCDDPADPAYNKLVHLPYQADAEKMWREDHAYDALAVIGYNDAPVIPGLGSAIFLHVARPDASGNLVSTAGCVSLPLEALISVLAACTPATTIRIRTI